MTITKQEYKSRWLFQTDELNRIAWNLTEEADRVQLYSLIESLNKLVETATNTRHKKEIAA